MARKAKPLRPLDVPTRETFTQIDRFFARGAEAVRVKYDLGHGHYHLEGLDQSGLDQFRTDFAGATPASFQLTGDLADFCEVVRGIVSERKSLVIAPLDGRSVRVYHYHHT